MISFLFNFLIIVFFLIKIFTINQTSLNYNKFEFSDYNEESSLYNQQFSYYYKLIEITNSSLYFYNYNKCETDCIGIEIEVEFKNKYPNLKLWKNLLNQNFDNKNKWSQMIFIKNDYTVPFGIEINFQPINFNKIESINWQPFFDLLKKENAVTHIDTGLHLHLPFSDTKIINLKKIVKYLIINKSQMIKIMDRENRIYARYCTLDELKEDYKKCISKGGIINVNFLMKTIEIRGFKTTLDIDKFKKFLYFMQQIDNYGMGNIDEIQLID